MIKHSGFIEFVKGDGKSFKMDDGKWYSVFSASQLKAAKGDYVEFNYVVNGSFNNAKGTVSTATPPAGAKASGSTVMGASKSGFVAKEFPVPPLHPDRSIIRQNSLTHATRVVMEGCYYSSLEEAATTIIETARMFEAYSCGDLDLAAAEESVRLTLASETSR